MSGQVITIILIVSLLAGIICGSAIKAIREQRERMRSEYWRHQMGRVTEELLHEDKTNKVEEVPARGYTGTVGEEAEAPETEGISE